MATSIPSEASLTTPTSNGHTALAVPSAARLAVIAAPTSPSSEAYRSLAVSIQFASPDRPPRSILVTSPGDGEGASTTVANLAAAYAEMGRNVLLVDAHLRRPSLHTLVGVDGSRGLSTWLVEGGALPVQTTSVPGVHLLPAGPVPANPIEVLGSARIPEFFSDLAEKTDLVLVDSAPCGTLADTALLAPCVDGVVLAIGAGRTRRDRARAAQQRLEQVHAVILGAVLVGA
jgi:capsular exopolysaccharide synthesis family protein